MTSRTRVPKAHITGAYGAVLKKVTTKMLGDVPEPLEVMWHNRPVLAFSIGLGRKARKWERVRRGPEVLRPHGRGIADRLHVVPRPGVLPAHNEGLDVAKAREVPRWRESEVFTPLERDVLEYAEAMTQTPPTVTDALSARLLEQLGAAAMIELTAWVALANQYARTNVALGIEAQGFASACGLAPLAEPSGVASTA
jgi:hypothetical protein